MEDDCGVLWQRRCDDTERRYDGLGNGRVRVRLRDRGYGFGGWWGRDMAGEGEVQEGRTSPVSQGSWGGTEEENQGFGG